MLYVCIYIFFTSIVVDCKNIQFVDDQEDETAGKRVRRLENTF